jgi:hypothetical protein
MSDDEQKDDHYDDPHYPALLEEGNHLRLMMADYEEDNDRYRGISHDRMALLKYVKTRKNYGS